MKTVIGKFDRATGTVTVNFASGNVEHPRLVNAVLKQDGGYDQLATGARVAEVAAGVQRKIELGVIGAPNKTRTTCHAPAFR